MSGRVLANCTFESLEVLKSWQFKKAFQMLGFAKFRVVSESQVSKTWNVDLEIIYPEAHNLTNTCNTSVYSHVSALFQFVLLACNDGYKPKCYIKHYKICNVLFM